MLRCENQSVLPGIWQAATAWRGWLFLVLLGLPLSARADEGMWLFNQLPAKQLVEKYAFKVTPEWAQHLMLSAVRFNSGGSASFVSSNGLVLTNHHVAAETLHKLSTAEHNYYQDGFLAASFAEELKAPDLELNQLVSIEDVTELIDGAVDAAMDPAQAAKARQAKMAEIEKASLDTTGLRSDVVTLYGGGRYHLYRYKKFTDVRLVWAPEADAAFFGGDADNFEYPRYCLDVTLFRVYENGEPAKISSFLRTDPLGATDGDLIFVAGNPGRTRRIYTAAALAFQRDQAMPRTLNLLRRKENLLQQYGLLGPEAERRSRDDLFGVQNSRKAYTGMLQGLQEPSFLTAKRQAEQQLLERLQSDPKLAMLSGAWKSIEELQQRRQSSLTQWASFRTRLYGVAQTLVLMAAEDQKPSPERLREFRDSNRESLLQELYSPAPIYPDLERVELADELSRFLEDRGGEHPLSLAILQGTGPRERASQILAKTQLFDVANRRALAAGGQPAIESSSDPLIALARTMETEYRRLDGLQDEMEEIERQAYAKINQAQFAIQGSSVYPDATFSLRLAYGTVRGYEIDGETIPSRTTLGGAFAHEESHQGQKPWELPDSWHRARSQVAAETPFNFVCTADIIGGNSGSPVVDRQGRLVGIIFDGNIQSLTADFYYADKLSRAVAVHIAGVLEALRKIYHADGLVSQIGH
jgi:hypothetical protein